MTTEQFFLIELLGKGKYKKIKTIEIYTYNNSVYHDAKTKNSYYRLNFKIGNLIACYKA